jgi:hypothetical protein
MESDLAMTHRFRREVDAIIQEVGQAKEAFQKGKRELSLAYTKLQEAKMWLGKVLEELGNELPEQYQDKAMPSTATTGTAGVV